ncbi:hypothetical protein [Aurantimonas endophytica]|uniref:Uncharacterized protein n=1 Tax=Aurantimonas endophytica TaxID=1522175 RepID=A0A7W6MML1_9HYPH|nr:hypothetical protein [Aurantimonas endophytica]MBB4000980.1 hypothetical protein [Aurantimonas endophytica]MCO6403361.1 hypothetical protein [Aurantimonas endophytica]
MAVQPLYATGTATVTSGSATVTGTGTAWTIGVVNGGIFSRNGFSIPIASIESNTSLTLAYPWPSGTSTGAYAISLGNSGAASAITANARLAELVAQLSEVSPFVRTLFDDADAEAVRASLEVPDTTAAVIRREYATVAAAKDATIPAGIVYVTIPGQATYERVTEPALGAELITNGDFSVGTGWLLIGTNPPTISSGRMNFPGPAAGTSRQSALAVVSQQYRLSYTVLNRTAGTATFVLDDLTATNRYSEPARSTNGTFVAYPNLTSLMTNLTIFGTNFVGAIDDISLRPILAGQFRSADGQWWAQAAASVAYTPQFPTAGEQAQARSNIGATATGSALFTAASAAVARTTLGIGLPVGWLFGLAMANNAPSPARWIDIAAGSARDEADSADLRLSPGTSKNLGAVWAAGAAGGLDVGPIANNTWYHLFLIGNPTTGAVDAIFSTSLTNPALPSGWTKKRRIGAVLTDGSANIRRFTQNGDHFQFAVPASNNSAAVAAQTRVLRDLNVPPGLKIMAEVTAIWSTTVTTNGGLSIVDPVIATGPGPGSATQAIYRYNSAAQSFGIATLWVTTDTERRVAAYDDAGLQLLALNTRGYLDRRGRDVA